MAKCKQTKKVKGKFPSLKVVKTGLSQLKAKPRRATSAHSYQTLNKWKKETMQQAVEKYRASRMPGYKGKPV